MRLAIFLRFCLERVFCIWSSSSAMSFWRSMACRSLRTAAAPISALNSSPYFAHASAYSSSPRIWPVWKGVLPGWTTIQSW